MFENERDSSTVFCFNLKSWIDHYANGRMPTFWPTPQLAPLPLANSTVSLVWLELGKPLQHVCRSIFQP